MPLGCTTMPWRVSIPKELKVGLGRETNHLTVPPGRGGLCGCVKYTGKGGHLIQKAGNGTWVTV